MKKIYLSIFAVFILLANVVAQCPTSISASQTITTATCPSNGAFTISTNVVGGGPLPYTLSYQITNGPAGYPTGPQGSPTFANLLPGDYIVKVSCLEDPSVFTTTSFTIPSTYVQIAANSVVSNVCTSGIVGTITTTVTATSSTTFSYAYWQGDPALSDNSLTYQVTNTTSTTNAYTAPTFGTYNVRTKDACGVFVTQQVAIANPYPANLCVTGIYFGTGGLTCPQSVDSIMSFFTLGNNIPFSALPAAGIDIDVYTNTGTCASPVQGDLVSTTHYTNTSSGNFIKVPKGKNLFYIVRTPCGTSCTYCYTYRLADQIFSQGLSIISSGCVDPNDPITYSVTVGLNNPIINFNITWVIKNSAGDIVGTYTAYSRADLPHSFNGLPSGTYTSIATDGCGTEVTDNIAPYSGTPRNELTADKQSFVGCASIEGRTTMRVYIVGVMANLANATATIIAPSPNLIGVAGAPLGYTSYEWNNVIPGATYYIEVNNGCGQSDIVEVVVPTTSALIQHTNATVEQLCGGSGNIIVDAAYNGWGTFSYQITDAANTVVGTGSSGLLTYTNLPAGTYTITSTVLGCTANYSYSSQVTILPSGSGPQIIKKLGVICEDASGNPMATGSALISFIGAKKLKVDYRLTSGNDGDYVNLTNDSDGSETIGGLTAYTSYTFRVSDVCGNATVSEISIGELGPLTTTSPGHPCVGSPYVLGVPDFVDATYTWTKNGVTISTNRTIVFPNYTAGNDGVYTCTVVVAGGCVTRTVTVNLISILCNIPLPIKLSDFTVQKIGNKAKVSWTTEEEINSSHFNIERSVDGNTWTTIATINAAGNSTQKLNYSIYDNAPVKGINYYRLKSIDTDTKFEYSAIKSVLFKPSYTVEVAPNPAKNFIHVYLEKAGTQAVAIQLLAADGKLVYQTTSSQSHLQIDVAGRSKGVYFVKVIDANEVTVIKVIVD